MILSSELSELFLKIKTHISFELENTGLTRMCKLGQIHHPPDVP